MTTDTDETTAHEDQSPGTGGRGFLRFWVTLPGVLTALATLVAAAGTFAGIFIHQQAEVIDDKTQQLNEAIAAPVPTVTVTVTEAPQAPIDGQIDLAGGDVSGADAPIPGTVRYLADLDSVQSEAWPLEPGDKTISNKQYSHSLLMGCYEAPGSYAVYDIHGSSSLTAQVGIADDATDANGVIATVSFTDQDGEKLGKATTVSVGHSQTVTLPTSNVVQLKVSCVSRDKATGDGRSVELTLGDAAVH